MALLRRLLPLSGLALLILSGLPSWSPAVLAQNLKPDGNTAPIKLLKIEPVKGYAGDFFTISGEGLPAGKKADFFWSTADAEYATKVLSDNVEYHERKYDDKRVAFGSAVVDAEGRVSANLPRRKISARCTIFTP